MTDGLVKLIKLMPKRWQQPVIYGLTFVVLLVLGVLSQLEKFLTRTFYALRRQKSALSVGLAVLALVIVSLVTLAVQSPGKEPEVIAYSIDTPSEVKPSESFDWRGNPDDPKKIYLPSVGTDGFIQKVGKDQNQQVAVPNNIHIAGWFVDSVRPGQPGLSVIDGHVDGRSAEGGIFKQLGSLKENDEFQIELGNGTRLAYRVLNTVSVPTEQAVSVLFSQNPDIKSQLNLITCGGRYNQDTRSYDQRVIVSAELVVAN